MWDSGRRAGNATESDQPSREQVFSCSLEFLRRALAERSHAEIEVAMLIGCSEGGWPIQTILACVGLTNAAT
jgi:hypothetical protein